MTAKICNLLDDKDMAAYAVAACNKATLSDKATYDAAISEANAICQEASAPAQAVYDASIKEAWAIFVDFFDAATAVYVAATIAPESALSPMKITYLPFDHCTRVAADAVAVASDKSAGVVYEAAKAEAEAIYDLATAPAWATYQNTANAAAGVYAKAVIAAFKSL
jgi:hypothetical protein